MSVVQKQIFGHIKEITHTSIHHLSLPFSLFLTLVYIYFLSLSLSAIHSLSLLAAIHYLVFSSVLDQTVDIQAPQTDGLSGGGIAGIVIGFFVVLGLVILLVVGIAVIIWWYISNTTGKFDISNNDGMLKTY